MFVVNYFEECPTKYTNFEECFKIFPTETVCAGFEKK
jgi:hypothetical protein